MVIDVYGNYGWIKPLKDRKGKTITEVFKTIFKEGRQPQYLWVDKGKEFYNKHLKELLDKHSIKYTQQKMKKKSSVVERWNRSMRQRMWKQFTVHGNTTYFDVLPHILKKYSKTKHSTIKMTPTEASKKRNKGTVQHVY